MRIYLSAPYAEKPRMQQISQQLALAGHHVGCRWLSEPHEMPDQGTPGINDQDPRIIAWRQTMAREDLEDVLSAQALIAFTSPPNYGPRRGARHTEVGIALAAHIPVIAVGPQENIFYYLPEVTVVPTIEEAIRKLNQLSSLGLTPTEPLGI